MKKSIHKTQNVVFVCVLETFMHRLNRLKMPSVQLLNIQSKAVRNSNCTDKSYYDSDFYELHSSILENYKHKIIPTQLIASTFFRIPKVINVLIVSAINQISFDNIPLFHSLYFNRNEKYQGGRYRKVLLY